MRKFIIPIVTVLALGASAPALAFDSGDQVSMEVALGIATNLGIRTVSNTEFLGDEWQIQGRDRTGRWMEVYVDANTGDVRNVERGW
ncbi:PepSY domain-containing protein [Bradyrhizobium sp. UFLA05-109]